MNRMLLRIQNILHTIGGKPPLAYLLQFMKKYKIFPKIICLGLAILFWLYVDSKRLGEAHFKVPVRVDLSREFAVSEIEKRYITVIARGSADDLRSVRQENISVHVKIQNPDLNINVRYPVSVTPGDVPETVSVVPEDKALFVKVERRISKKIRVVPVLNDAPDVDYLAGNPRITPDEVDVSGAESIVRKLVEVRTESYSLSGKRVGFEEQLRLLDEDVKNCELSHKTVALSVPIYSAKEITRVIVDIQIRNASDEYRLIPSKNKVQIYVKGNMEISPDDYEAWIDASEKSFASVHANEDTFVGTFTVRIKGKTVRAVEAIVPDRIDIRARKR
jgi:YbbR domain-containing protein